MIREIFLYLFDLLQVVHKWAIRDEFNIVEPVAVPFTLGTWKDFDVEVEFCPEDGGAETTNLIVEYGSGKTMIIPINGGTPIIFDYPYMETFNCEDKPDNHWCGFGTIVNTSELYGGYDPRRSTPTESREL